MAYRRTTPAFTRFVAIDWSGAKGSRHPGVAVASCDSMGEAPSLVPPPARHWSRSAVLDWVLTTAAAAPTLFGFDFSFAPPFLDRDAYLPGASTARTAPEFWAEVDARSPVEDLGAASFLTTYRGHFYAGRSDGPKQPYLRYRRCELACRDAGLGRPAAFFDAIGPAQVAKGSLAGMRLLHRLHGTLPIWPIDPLPAQGSALVELYPRIATGPAKLRSPAALDAALARWQCPPHAPLVRYDDHATDALAAAAWLRCAAVDPALWSPSGLTPAIALTEGWTFGVGSG